MSHIITCPRCGQQFTIEAHQRAQYIGRSIQCTQCGTIFAVELEPQQPARPEPVISYSNPRTLRDEFEAEEQPSNYQPSSYPEPKQQGPKASGIAVTSLVLACIGLLVAPLGLVAIVLGIIALLKSRDQRVGGRGLAIAGITIGGASVAISACMFAILVPSMSAAREAANREKCQANLRQIGQALIQYANANRGNYPVAMSVLQNTQGLSADTLCCPSIDASRASGKPTYLYVGKGMTTGASADAVVAYEPPAHHDDDGCNFLYADGHVSFENKAAANAIIAEIGDGNNPPRWNVVQQAVANSANSANAKR